MINFRRLQFDQDKEKKGCLAAGFACLTLLLVLAASPSHAQQITGSIVGTVNDQQGAVISGATVKATNPETAFSRTVTANGYGQYRIDYLPIGTYTIEVDANGFKRYVQENVVLMVDQTQTVPVSLSVGTQTQTVTVTDAPPVVDTSSAELGRTIDPAEIIGLPLVNRNAYAQLSLTPGVQANSASPSSNPNGTPNFVIGLPSADVQINGSIDGGNPRSPSTSTAAATSPESAITATNYPTPMPWKSFASRPATSQRNTATCLLLWSRRSPSRERTNSTDRYSSSTAIPTSMRPHGTH